MYHIHSSTKAIKIGKSLRETLKDLYFILTLTELQISFTVLQVPTKIPDGHNNLIYINYHINIKNTQIIMFIDYC